jgi:hypothetical protein
MMFPCQYCVHIFSSKSEGRQIASNCNKMKPLHSGDLTCETAHVLYSPTLRSLATSVRDTPELKYLKDR